MPTSGLIRESQIEALFFVPVTQCRGSVCVIYNNGLKDRKYGEKAVDVVINDFGRHGRGTVPDIDSGYVLAQWCVLYASPL